MPLSLENNDLVMDKDYLSKMLEFHRKVNPKEGLVGLYLSGTSIDGNAIGLYRFYQTLLNKERKGR